MTNKILAILQFEKCDYIKCKDGGYFIHEKHCISKQRVRDAINKAFDKLISPPRSFNGYAEKIEKELLWELGVD